MTMFAPLAIVLAPLLLAFAPGWALLAVLWPDGFTADHVESQRGRSKRIAARLLRLAIAWPLGVAICSVIHFAAFTVFDGKAAAVFTIETLVVIASLGVIVWSYVRAKRAGSPAIDASTPALAPAPLVTRAVTGLLALATIACLIPSFGAIVGRTLVHPHGWWDAWMIWNCKARVLFLGDDLWMRAFAPGSEYAHKDYPLLVPLSVTRIWYFAGEHTLLGPIAYGFGSTAAALLLLFASLWRLRDASQALLALLITCAAPLFVDNAWMQLADVPLSIFFLTAFVSYTCVARNAGAASNSEIAALGPRVVIGLCLGAASWTKNEGILFMLVFLLATVAFEARAAGLKPALRSLIATLAGAAIFGACILAHKLAHAGDTDLFRDRTLGDLARLAFDTRRHDIIYRGTRKLIEINIGTKVALTVLAFIIAAALARQPGSRRQVASSSLVSATVIALVVAGYYVTYLLTPHDLVWHLGTSGMRLMWQLWPAGAFATLMILPSPAELVLTLLGRESLPIPERQPT